MLNIFSKFNSYRINRKLQVIRSIPRFQSSYIDLFGVRLNFVDSASFFFQFRDIFQSEIYRFVSKKRDPFIIDCGANIGLSVIYFKQLFQESRILAFEPDRHIFFVLKNNIKQYGYNNIELINKAVWVNDTMLEFIPDGSDGGRIFDSKLNTFNETFVNKTVNTVSAIALSDYMNEHIDFLKIDIEGAENVVLKSCRGKLENVQNLFVEYHSHSNKKQELHELLSIIADANFRVYINPVSQIKHPFIRTDKTSTFDIQLNIFAFRD